MSQDPGGTKKASDAPQLDEGEALRRGEITRDEYLEQRLEAQIKRMGLDDLLNPQLLELLRETLREEFFDSPVFDEYLEIISGTKTPSK